MERLTQKSDKMIWLKDQGLKIEPCEMNSHHCRMILEKLAEYEDLEERLHKIFGEESTFSLADVIDALEMKLSEPDKKHPVNARILTYEEANKWQEYKDLEEQGLLVRLPCKVGYTVYKFWYYDRSPYKIQQHVTRTLSEICELIESKKLGKSVFLTREEAEKKLEEMGNDKT